MSGSTSSRKRSIWSVGTLIFIVAGAVWYLWPKSHPPQLPERLETVKEQHDRIASSSVPSATDASTKPVISNEFPDNLYDPDAAGANPELGLPVSLDPVALKTLAQGVDDISVNFETFRLTVEQYGKLQRRVFDPSIKEILYQRIASGKGFKHPDLPVVWSKYVNEGTDFDLPTALTADYMHGRLAAIKSQVISGTTRDGDIKFVTRGAIYLKSRLQRADAFLSTAYRMYGWLCDEGLATREENLNLEQYCDDSTEAIRPQLNYLIQVAAWLKKNERYTTFTPTDLEHVLCVPPMIASAEQAEALLRDKSIPAPRRIVLAGNLTMQLPYTKRLKTDINQLVQTMSRILSYKQPPFAVAAPSTRFQPLLENSAFNIPVVDPTVSGREEYKDARRELTDPRF